MEEVLLSTVRARAERRPVDSCPQRPAHPLAEGTPQIGISGKLTPETLLPGTFLPGFEY